MPQFPHKLGALPDVVDTRDRPYRYAALAASPAAAQLPVLVDNRHQCGPVWHQRDVPSCVGMAMAAVGQFLFWKKFPEFREVSPHAQYRWSQDRDRIPGHSYPGTTLGGGCRAGQKDGFCPMGEWPDPGDIPDDTAARRAAKTHRLDKYERLRTISQVKHAIHQVGIVACTIMVHEGWIDPPNGRIQPGKNEEGYHAIALVGYDDNKGVFILRNSWGPEWAHGGYCELPDNEWYDRNQDNWACYVRMGWLDPVASFMRKLTGRIV